MQNDPIVEEVRNAREEHARRHGYDIGRITEALKDAQAKSGRRLVRRKPKPYLKKSA